MTLGKVSRTTDDLIELNRNRNIAWRLSGALSARITMFRTIRNVLPDREPPTSRICFAPLVKTRCASCCLAVSLKLLVNVSHRDHADAAGVLHLLLIAPVLPLAVLEPIHGSTRIRWDVLPCRCPYDLALELEHLLAFEGVSYRPLVQTPLHSLVSPLLPRDDCLAKFDVFIAPAVDRDDVHAEEVSQFNVSSAKLT